MTVSSSQTKTVFAVLGAISFSHLLNDMIQSLLPAIYPMLKLNLGLSFSQIGLITLTNQVTASLLQPIVGHYNDRRSYPYALSMGMAFSFAGMLLLAWVGTWKPAGTPREATPAERAAEPSLSR